MSQSEQVTHPSSDPFADVRNKRMDELSREQQDRAMELWMRTNIKNFPAHQLDHISALLRIVDRSRGIAGERETALKKDASAVEPGSSPYNERRIAWELERTALGEAFFGNALRVAKDIHHLTAEDRSVLDRFATGANEKTDHVALQDIARSILHGCSNVVSNQEPEHGSLEEQLAEARGTAEFFKKRCDVLQQFQQSMRDPERTLVCDILANGQPMHRSDGKLDVQRYAMPDQEITQQADQGSRPRES